MPTGLVVGGALYAFGGASLAVATGAALATQGFVEQKAAGRAAQRFAEEEARASGLIAAENRKQFSLQQRISDIKNARERAQIARQASIARGRLVNLGATTGTLESTGVAGGVASITSQEASIGGSFGAVAEAQGLLTESQQRVATQAGVIGQAQAGQVGARVQSSEGAAMFGLGTDIFAAGGGWKTRDNTKK